MAERRLPDDVLRLVLPDGSVVVRAEVVPWLETQLREHLRKARGNPSAVAVTQLMAFTVGAERFESAGQSSFSGTRQGPSEIIEVGEIASPFLTSAQAAELTERTERGIRKACERGSLPARKFGKAWHIHPMDLDNYIHGERPN